MPRPPETQRRADTKRGFWTLAWSGTGFLSTLAMCHSLGAPPAVSVIAGTVVAGLSAAGAFVVIAVCELSPKLPDIIEALGAKKAAGIRARTEAEVAREGSRRLTALVSAALDGKHGELDAVTLLKLEILRDRLRSRPELSEDMLRELLPAPRGPGRAEGWALMSGRHRKPG